MKALALVSTPAWWVKGRRKVRASPVLQTLLLLFMLLAMFGPLLNLLIWTVAESWYFPHSLPSRWGAEVLVSSFQSIQRCLQLAVNQRADRSVIGGGLFADFRTRRLCAFPAENAITDAVHAAISYPAGLS
ncbi:ABC transporter permease [Klebsiella pneumoniae]|uniref:ABC transporter permease n=1 Tax=Klebsiella pneumoniae TaxID=573 RepID=A0A2X3FPL1_KLEPN|nr:ABC transporter permease [Klebsiella pneumoniae]